MAVEQIYSKTSNTINFSATMIWNMLRDAMQIPNWHPFMWHNANYDSPDPNSIGVDHVVNWPDVGEMYMGIYKFYELSDIPAEMHIRYNVTVLVSNSNYAGDWDNYVDFTVTSVGENSCTVKLDRLLNFDEMPPVINRQVAIDRTVWLADEILSFIEGVQWDSSIEQLKNPNKAPVPPIPVPGYP